MVGQRIIRKVLTLMAGAHNADDPQKMTPLPA